MSLGYSPETKEKAALSFSPWEKTGYVTVRRTVPRSTLLKAISGEIVKTRQKEHLGSEQKKR